MVKGGPEFNKRLPRFLRHEDIPTDTFTPRTYQVELLDAALHRNTIICLGSNSGKAFIALMAIKEMAHQIRKAYDDGGKRTVYLVVSDLAAEVEWQILQHHTDLTVGKYTSDTNLDDWKQEDWLAELREKQILVMVADVFRTALDNNFLPLSSLNLVIFDDCHLAVGDHHYVHIMDHLSPSSDEEQPQILGLTAAILGSRCNDPSELRNAITSLEAMLHSRAETSMLVISERYGSRPKEVVYQCEPVEPLDITLVLKTILENALFFLYELQFTEEECGKKDPRHIPRNALSECHNILLRLGPWCAARIAEMLITQIEKSEKQESHPIPKRLLRFASTQLRYITKVFDKDFTPDYVVEEFLEYTTPKVVQLVDILRKYKPDLDFMIISNEDSGMSDESDLSDDSMDLSDSDDDEGSPSTHSNKQIHIAVKRSMDGFEDRAVSCFLGPDEKKLIGVVFVEQRYVAFALNKLIEEVCGWDENLCFIKSNHLTGPGWKGGKMKKDTGRVYRKQEETLRKFRMQELNLLISTSVLEEGVDIPKCNLVVRFDPPKDYRSYTLAKGRARSRDAEYIILVERDKKNTFTEELKIFKGIEEVLIGDGRGRKDLADEADEINPDTVVDMLPPYSPTDNPSGPKVTMQTAIALVNRYCAKLPSDAFTHLTPHCSIAMVTDTDTPMFVASLRLPVNSSIKQEIMGVAMPSKKLAKMAVALKMCEKLHKAGELDDNLMPVGKEMFVYEEEEEWEEEDVAGQARPGTTKRKQYYYKKAADAFVQSHVRPDEPCNLYFINLKLTGPITDEQNTRGRRIYAPEDTAQSLGLLSSKEIPLVPHFPVYTRSGEVTVSVDLIQSNVVLGQEDLKKIGKFHQFVFTSVLHLEKDPMEFAVSSADVGYLIVPLDKDVSSESGFGIQWDFVNLVQSTANPEKKKNVFDKKRGVFEFRQEDFADAVVMPSYRNIDQPQHFYVAEIRFDLNPTSPFPSPELYKTFNEYYTTKYGLTITNTDQPLLDVDHTSARLNLLTPRYMNQKGVALPTSSAETKRARRENLQQKQILVPELCDIHVFPASLWRKAVCLPAVLYRMNYLLLAEEIRKRIAKETGIGVVELPCDFRFPQLDFGFETNPEKLKCDSEEGQDKDVSDDEKQNSFERQESPTGQVHTCDSSQKSDEKDKLPFSPSESSPPNISRDDLKAIEDKGEMSSDSDSGITSAGSEVSVADIGAQPKCDTNSTDQSAQPNTNTHDASTSTTGVQSKTDHADTSATAVQHQTDSAVSDADLSALAVQPQTASAMLGTDICAKGVQLQTDIAVSDAGTSATAVQPETECAVKDADIANMQKKCITSAQTIATTSTTNMHDSIMHNNDSNPSQSDCSPTGTRSLQTGSTVSLIETSSKCVETLNKPKPQHQTDCFVPGTETSVSGILPKTDCTVPDMELSVVSKQQHCSKSFVESTSSDDVPLVTGNVVEVVDNRHARFDSVLETNSMQIKNRNDSLCLMNRNVCENFVEESGTADFGGNDTQWCSVVSNANVCSSAQSAGDTPKSIDAACTLASPDHGPVLNTSPSTAHNGTNIIHNQTSHSSERCSSLAHAHSEMVMSEPLKKNIQADTQMLDNPIPSSLQVDHFQYTSSTPWENSSASHHGDVTDPSVMDSCQQVISETEQLSTETTAQMKLDDQGKDSVKADCQTAQYSDASKQSSMSKSDLLSEPGAETVFNANHLCDSSDQTKDSPASGWDDDSVLQLTSIGGPSVRQQQDETEGNVCEKDNAGSCSNDADADFGVWSYPGCGEPCHDSDASSSATSEEMELELTSQPNICLDEDRDLSTFVGPSPCLILQALTMSNANDFFSLERLETIGDSFLKYAITVYLYCSYPGIHEGKLSYLRSKQVSNYNLYRLGRKRRLAECMVSAKFEPYENWLPPGYIINENRRRGPVPRVVIANSGKKMSSNAKKTDSDSTVAKLFEDKKKRDRSKHDKAEACDVITDKEKSDSKDVSEDSEGNVTKKHGCGETDDILSEAKSEGKVADNPETENKDLSDEDCKENMPKKQEADKIRTDMTSKDSVTVKTKTVNKHGVAVCEEGSSEDVVCEESLNEDAGCDTESVDIELDYALVNTSALSNSAASHTSAATELTTVVSNPEYGDGTRKQSGCVPPMSDVERQKFDQELEEIDLIQEADKIEDLTDDTLALVPYSLQTQHGIPDKSVADSVEALIGCYLTTCGKKAALMFMSWLGLKVLPRKDQQVGIVRRKEGQQKLTTLFIHQVSEYEFEELQCPPSPLFLAGHQHANNMLIHLLDGYNIFEEKIGYTFQDRSYLLQAFTHASYHYNSITDCYQRLEFLGDAILDYVITRHLYEDSQKYSPGILTDLRSALVNNNIFAALAVKWDFHKYFKAISPALFHVIEKFVARQKDKEDEIDIEDEFQMLEDGDEDSEQVEEVELEIPKALGDIFESVAGAIYLDSGMSLDTVWRVYYRIMRPQIEKYLKSIPKSPVRELLELEPETAKFEKPERTMEGKIRVTVNVVGKGVFSGIGRNYRIAKSAAAKKALRIIRSMQMGGLE
ncbi:endoribonuclease Dicer-like [Haliotis asinina]|uniref:endoribonuclease Dicer-like n=1 Tax=Haliotis asinina TaxID=109174 RepID=UPI0035318538